LFQNQATGLCLSVANLSGANGTRVVQASCNAQDGAQVWSDDYSNISTRGIGFPTDTPDARPVMRVNLGVGKCLDVENGTSDLTFPMQVWDCNFNTKNQAWWDVRA
jgi:hypothetical protein